MPNNRSKGKVFERWFVNNGLRNIFPDIRRNAGTQAQAGGVDLENTGIFDFEVKAGKAYKSKMVRGFIDQVQQEGKKENWKCVLVKPDREEAYGIVPYKDLLEILNIMKSEGIL
jgi:hypothetical protein